MIPSKSPYSRGWSSTCTARRLSAGLREGPLGTAQDFKTPSISRRRSKCSRRAACWWTTNRPPALGAATGPPKGSGVASSLRLARYALSASGFFGGRFAAMGRASYHRLYERTCNWVRDPLVRAGFRAHQAVFLRRILRRHLVQLAAQEVRLPPESAVHLLQGRRQG